jgi:hypothetical protein
MFVYYQKEVIWSIMFYIDFYILFIYYLNSYLGKNMQNLVENKSNEKKKVIALNVPMDQEFMNRIELAAKKMHVGKAAYTRMAIEEKLQRDNK